MIAGCDRCRTSAAGPGYLVASFNDAGFPSAVKRCDCAEAALRDKRLRRLRRQLPLGFADLSLDRPPLTHVKQPALTRVEAYRRDLRGRVRTGRGLWLQGSSGSGKTAAACFLVREARLLGIAAEFWPVPELLVRLARVRHDEQYVDFDHEEVFLDALAEVDLLVLDDLSASKTTPWALEQLYLIVNRRYNDTLATILTTDLDVEELTSRFGYRLVRRLKDMTGRRVDFDADDEPESSIDEIEAAEERELIAARLSGPAARGPVVVENALELGPKFA